jgi:RNA polymerase sigma-70 factor (ECF subfamily)
LSNENDTAWIETLGTGDDRAYKALFERFFSPLCSFAARYLEGNDGVEDMVQEVLFECWHRRSRFDTLVALKTYLYRGTRNKCLDALKHRRVRERYLTRQSLEEQSEFFLHQVLEEEVYTLLKEAIDSLPEPTRAIYNLTLLGHDNPTIASLLGLSLDAVKSRKKRGNQLLREKLKNMFILLLPLI